MRRLLPLLLALSAAAAPPPLPAPPAEFTAADQEIDALQERMTSVRQQAEPLLDELAKFAVRYVDPAGFALATQERVPLRDKLKAMTDELAAGQQRYDELREQTQMKKVVAGLQLMLKKGDMPPATGVEFVRSNVRVTFSQEVQRFREVTAAALHLDEESYRAAEARAELERRRGLETWAVGAGAGLVLVILALLVDNARLRRALRPKAALPPPAR